MILECKNLNLTFFNDSIMTGQGNIDIPSDKLVDYKSVFRGIYYNVLNLEKLKKQKDSEKFKNSIQKEIKEKYGSN